MRARPLPSMPERALRAILGDTTATSTIIGDLREEYLQRTPGLGRSVSYALASASIAVRYLPPLLLDILRVDLRHAVRGLARARTYTAASVLALGVGIAVAATLLTITYGSLVRPLPYPDADALVGLGQSPLTGPGAGSINSIAVANLRDLSTELDQFTGLAGFSYRRSTTATAAGAERILLAAVTGNFFEVLGARPLLGRTFVPDDDPAGGERTVVLAERLWRRDFAAATDIVGRLVDIDTLPHRVIGVMPQHLPWPGDPQAWVPMQWTAEEAAVRSRRQIEGIGRLRSGASLAAGADELTTRFAALAAAYPDDNGRSTVAVRPLRDIMLNSLGPNSSLLPLLTGLAGLMLLVAYLNLGTLALGRMEARQQEFALRHLLGASGWRQSFTRWTESGLIAGCGAAVGALLTAWSIPIVIARYGSSIARSQTIGFDESTVAVIAVATLGGAVVMSVTGRRSATSSIGDLNRRAVTGRGALRRRLVAVQVGLACGLIYGAVLLGSMLASLARVDLGVPLDGAVTFAVGVPAARYDTPMRIGGFFSQLEAELRSVPGVVAVGATSRTPFAGGTNGGVTNASDPGRTEPLAEWRVVTPGFFPALGLSFVDGAPFTEASGGDERSVIVSADLSTRLFGTTRSVGQRVSTGSAAPYVVSGVVTDIRDFGPTRPGRPTIYFRHASETGFPAMTDLTFVVRATVPPLSLAGVIRERVAKVDPQVPIRAVATLDELATQSMGANRTTAGTVLVTMASLALLLGMIGVFGVAAVSVEQRTREFGLRLALGDTPAGVLRRIMGDGLRLTTAGLLLGALAAWWVQRLVKAFLVADHQPAPALTIALVIGVLVAASLVATLIPARRAARLSPLDALRAE